jgi:hypothetical protein
MADPTSVYENRPRDFSRFIAAPPHRLFAIFDEPAAGDEVIDKLRAEGDFSDEDDVWVLFGEEGRRRLDLSGSCHGLHSEMIRLVQRLMSSDMAYLRTLDKALRDCHMVVAVPVGHDNIDHVAEVLRGHSGHSLARVAHWDFVPLRT